MKKIRTFFKLITDLFTDSWLAIVTWLPGNSGLHLRRAYYRRKGAKIAEHVSLFTGVVLMNPAGCIFNQGSTLYQGCTIAVEAGGEFEIGERSHLGAGCYALVGSGKIHIGRGVAIGPHSRLIAQSNQAEDQKPVVESHYSGNISIGDDVLVGAGVTILPDVTIHDHAVCGAGAVVNQDIPEWQIAAGIPARILKERKHEGTHVD